MPDFKTALQEGFEAARKAEIARREVADVLEKLKGDLLAESDGKLLVELAKFEEQIALSPIERIQRQFSLEGVPKRAFIALAASNPKSATPEKVILARWSQAAEGYPCKVSWENQEHECQDRTALEETLADLLRSPKTGERLGSLMRT